MKMIDEGDTLAIPPALLAELQAEAAKEQRSSLDVLQDAVKRYVRDKNWQRTIEAGHARAKTLRLTEDDVPRLIAEYRKDQRHRL